MFKGVFGSFREEIVCSNWRKLWRYYYGCGIEMNFWGIEKMRMNIVVF